MNAEWLEAETDTDLNVADSLQELEIPSGTQLPITPELSGAAWATYSWPVAAVNGGAYARLQWSYMDETLNRIEAWPADGTFHSPQLKNDSYHSGDFSLGLRGDTWEATLFVSNITDERANYTSGDQMIWAAASLAEDRANVGVLWTNRPREFGVRVIKRWGG